jgi:circadian clock protein KaiB
MTHASTHQPHPPILEAEFCRLQLYVAGQSPKSLAALSNLRRLCEECMPGRYEIDVVDLIEHPELAAGHEIVAIPTVVRRIPKPTRRMIGDLSEPERVIVGLQMPSKEG